MIDLKGISGWKGALMALLEIGEIKASLVGPGQLSVVLCGSFRRDPSSLATTYAELRRSFAILSPTAVDFVDDSAEFVRLRDELNEPERDIEARHLAAMTDADFIWLHTPDGYVGTSAAMELGHATALGVPIFALTTPADPVLAACVNVVEQSALVTRDLLNRVGLPGQGIGRLQSYYRTTALRRGWQNESVNETVRHLAGELVELERAIRKSVEGVRSEDDPDADVAGELADVQLYLVHLANALGLDLAVAVTHKERVNALRFDPASSLA